jgi:hypothetical protein
MDTDKFFKTKVYDMMSIPVSAAKHIAKQYGYDQVVILARRVGEAPEPRGEHITTYGVNPAHCEVAAVMGDKLKVICGWPEDAHQARADARGVQNVYSGGLIREMIKRLKTDLDTFNRYGNLHVVKGTQDGHDKAGANFREASKIDTLLSRLKAAGYE